MLCVKIDKVVLMVSFLLRHYASLHDTGKLMRCTLPVCGHSLDTGTGTILYHGALLKILKSTDSSSIDSITLTSCLLLLTPLLLSLDIPSTLERSQIGGHRLAATTPSPVHILAFFLSRVGYSFLRSSVFHRILHNSHTTTGSSIIYLVYDSIIAPQPTVQ